MVQKVALIIAIKLSYHGDNGAFYRIKNPCSVVKLCHFEYRQKHHFGLFGSKLPKMGSERLFLSINSFYTDKSQNLSLAFLKPVKPEVFRTYILLYVNLIGFFFDN